MNSTMLTSTALKVALEEAELRGLRFIEAPSS
jgi:hypothetical protein